MAARGSRRVRGVRLALCCTGVATALCAGAPAASGAAADRYVYVSNGFTSATSQNVSAYRIGANGALVELPGSPFPTGATTQEGIAIMPDGAHLYVASFGTNQVMKFNVQADGTLTGLLALNPGGAFTTPLGVVPDPDGEFLYAWNHGNSIASTSVSATGTLTNVLGSPFTVASGFTNPFAGSVAPDGEHMYVPFENTDPGNGAPDRSGVYSISPTGVLVNQQNVITGGPAGADGNPFGSGITPDGRFVYISAPEDLASVGDIYGFSVNAVNGLLTAIPGSPFPVTPGGGHPLTIATSPDSEHLYVATRAADAVRAYNINQTTGALTSIGSFATGGTNGKSLALTPDGKRLYVANQLSDNISGFAVLESGALSLLPGSPYPTADSPDLESIAITPNQGPTASFTTIPGFAGQPTGFNATNSTDDGDIVRYDWDFGDGTTLTNGGPIPNHIYAAPGTFNVRLQVTDDENCSDDRIFTGKATLCNADAGAVQTTAVTVDNAPPAPAATNFSRTLTIKYNKKKKVFKGTVGSTSADCIDDERVNVFRKKKGPDPKLGSVDSGNDGKWRLKFKNADGKFYAVVDQTALPDDDVCLAVQSAKTKVG